MENLQLKPHIEKILVERYYLKNETSWTQLSKRISDIYPPMYEYILDRKFIPSTPTLMNLNTRGERAGTLSSCFIMGIDDSIDSIMDSMKEAALVTKAAGGVGYNFSKLRASNENVKSIGANSGGVMAFIQIFDAVLDGIRQGGKRRGAGMSMLSVYHPDILAFIDAKIEDTKRFTRSNFSVNLDKEFYKTLKQTPNKVFKTRNVVDGKEKDLVGNDGTVYTYKMLWDKIIHNAWFRAEPGIFNGDIAVDRCSCKHITEEVFCNPCSEYVHIPYTSCNLASFNVSAFIKDDAFNWDEFKGAVENSIVYMNGIIDNNRYPLEKIRSETLAVRPIGIGVMGMAHLLYKLGIPYDSDEAYTLVENVIKFTTLVGLQKSAAMAKESGKTYKYYSYETFMDANQRFFDVDAFMGIDVAKLKRDIQQHGIYNSCVTSIAPTGTISYIADCSGGIEPVFGLVFTRKIEKENKTYEHVYIVDPVFKEYIETTHPGDAEKIYKYVTGNNGSCKGCEYLSKKEQAVFKVAGDISPAWHLKILAATANNVSLSVSKTINLPSDCSELEVANVFIAAYELGIIGVTVYRDGCREGILVHDGDRTVLPDHVERHNSPKRPIDLPCDIHEMNVLVDGKKDRYVALVGKLAGTVYEIFVTKDVKNKLDFNTHKTGIIRKVKKGRYDLYITNGEEKICIEDISTVFGGQMGTLSRLVSMALRHGTPLQIVVDQLAKGTMISFLDFEKCVARVLKKYIKEGERVIISDKCPSCGGGLVYTEGCKSCASKCGWSKCV